MPLDAVKRPLLALPLLVTLLWATPTHAQEAPTPAPTPTPASTPTSAPTSTPTPAPTPTPPKAEEEFVPDPASRPTPHWYGWQPAIFDAAAAIQGLIANAIDEPALYVTAGATYFVGPVSTHLYHGRPGNVVVGAGIRIAGPGLGAITGYAIDKATSGGKSTGNSGTAIGVGIGCLVAAIVDDAWNSREMLQFWELGLNVTPTITRESKGLSVSGSF